jgi:hypothetical protein
MKKFLIALSFVVCLSTFTSCSVDDMDQIENPSASELKKLENNYNLVSRDTIDREDGTPVDVIDPIIKPKKD